MTKNANDRKKQDANPIADENRTRKTRDERDVAAGRKSKERPDAAGPITKENQETRRGQKQS